MQNATTNQVRLRILHIEDMKSDAELVERVLKKGNLDFDIEVVDKEEEFVEKLRTFKPHIILSDHAMPTFNSLRALNIVRNEGLRIPFILITGNVSEEYAVNVMKEGADDYILKDRLERLPTAVMQAIDKKDHEKERSEFIDTVMANEAILKETELLANVGSWNINFEDGVTSWTDETYRILGYVPGQVKATLENFLKHIHPSQAAGVRQLIDNAVNGLPSAKIDFTLVDKDGLEKDIFCRLVIKRKEDGTVKEIAGFIQDVTERKKAEAEIMQLNQLLERKVEQRTAQLEAANKELEAFCYSVSHDLRSPLRMLSGFSKILSKKYGEQLDTEGREYLDLINQNAIYLNKLIDELLSLSRFGGAAIHPLEVDMGKLVNVVLQEIEAGGGQNTAEVKINPMNNATCDPVLMRQVWVNLISNAVKYSSRTKKPVIEIGSTEQNGLTIYYVKDNGVGFDMKDADKLFGVFTRLHGENEFEGTGIGLALVHRIITKHGGKIWAEGEVNKGATFYFCINTENYYRISA